MITVEIKQAPKRPLNFTCNTYEEAIDKICQIDDGKLIDYRYYDDYNLTVVDVKENKFKTFKSDIEGDGYYKSVCQDLFGLDKEGSIKTQKYLLTINIEG